MNFELTSSQKIFYTKHWDMNHLIWNQGAIQTFPQVYSYRQLNDAFNDLVKKQDSLLVRFKETETDAYMTLQDFEYVDYPFVSVSTDEELEAEVIKALNEPIDLSDRLVNCTIFQTPTTSGLIINSHHIIVDGYSGLVMAEHINNYLKNPDYETPASRTYQEYIEKEQQYRHSKRFIKNQQFWLEQFAGEPNCSIFSKDTSSLDFSASEVNYDFTEDFYQKMKSFAEEYGISLASFFNMVYSVYFNRIYDVNNFTIGTPVLNRTTQAELHSIGLYMHILPMIVNITEDSFIENTRNIENSHLNLFRYQNFTQHDIIKLLKANAKNTTSLFDVVADYEEYPKKEDYDISVRYNETLSVPMEIHFFNMTDKHQLKIRYRKSVFTEKEIQTMMSCVISIIEDALENPNKKISEINMVSEDEKKKLFSFNDTSAEYESDKCIHELFEAQVNANPDKVAVVACDKTLTYSQLNEEANAIAHSLITMGIGKGDIVGLMLPRKSYLLSALLGILKSGAAYLPIDSELPAERIEYMCQDTNAALVISLDNIDTLLYSSDISNPNIKIPNDSLCYCIYTSGSTGLPKGVMAKHRNVVNYISKNKHNIAGKIITEDFEAIVSISTCSFDIFVTETILPLVNGLRTILADEQQCRNQYALNKLLSKEKGEFLQTTPTKLKVLTAEPTQREFLRNIKALLLGGEAMEVSYLNELKQLTNAKIYNIYGTTEVPIWSTIADTDTFVDAVTVGKPFANTQVYILDKHRNLVPTGVIGELCIAGDSVSGGYLGKPELTAEKFIDNPFGEGKLYKTGDLAYWREDGNIIFCGRNDFQVKIRGLRIELGEIESVLQAVEGIDRAVVVVRKDKSDRQLICAFYTGEDKKVLEIKENIGGKLPKYMIPHVFTHLEEMPLTASGKANRNALPEIDLENIGTDTEYVAPEADREIVLAECISAVLDTEKVSVLDNFFDIGGDSLKAIELTAKLEAKGYEVPVKTIFECKDIRDLATKLQEKQDEYIKVEYDSVLAATPAQMRVYTAQMLAHESTLYNVAYAFKVNSIDKERLEVAVNKLIERHESLRTHFETKDGIVYQVIDENASVSVEALTDINTFSKAFDLDKSPLIRVGCNNDTVVIDMHHIAVDGETAPVLFKELNELYMGREISGEAVQYGEFAVTNQYTAENEKYWLDIFSDEVSDLDLPKDYQRPAVQSFKGSIEYKTIEKSLHDKIESKCKKLGVTSYVYYTACLSVLLSKLSGNEDIVTGSPVSGRTSRFLNTVGMFVNTIALRSRPEGTKKFADLLNEIKDASILAIDNQNYPFGELVKKLGIDTAGRNPLFDVMLAYQSFEMTDITFGDEKAELLPLETTTAKCDMTFNILPRKDDVVFATEYCTDLYTAERISRFTDMYCGLLEACLDEEKLIKDISVISEEESKLLTSFNNTYVEYESDKCIHELFEAQVNANPDKIAVVACDKTLTYSQLNEEANSIAHSLIAMGIGKGDIVGLMLPRKSHLLSALFGILKSGASYLPIDPDHPEDRIQYMLADSGAKLCIDEKNIAELISNSNKNNTEVKVCSTDLCYCIYTSGSTGKPKGSLIYHRNLSWYIASLKGIYTKDCINMPVFTSQSVDLTVTSLFLPLVTGSTSYLYSGELKENLIDIFKNDKLSMIKLTPTHMDIICNLVTDYKRQNLSDIIVGGEALYRESCIRFLNKFGNHIRIHNEYGPTETTVGCMDYVFDQNTDAKSVPIGHPSDNVQIYIVDKYLTSVPIGVTGEICIAGDGVGAGYLNRQELTAEKFIDNPFGEGKLYKTGDLAYWREDGNIIFCGRNDFQVKIHGLRIELGEIENAIQSTDGVVQCTVVVKKDEENNQYICAFYTGTEISTKEFRLNLSSKLPKYMMPQVFTHLEEMPLTSSGKIDRKSLPEIDFANIAAEAEIVHPETETEKALAEVVSSLLKLNEVNMLDNFLSIGGDSIKAIYVVSDLEEMGYEIHVADIMQSETLADIAKAMKAISAKAVYDQNEVTGLIPYSPIMRAYIAQSGSIRKDFVHTCVISADCDEATAINALDILTSHHDILRGTFTENGIEVLSSKERKPYSFKSATIDSRAEAEKYLSNVKTDEDKLVNAVFCKTAQGNLLSVTIHHFLIDLVSWEVLMKDFRSLISQIKSGEEISLPAKTASFKLWSQTLKEYAETISEDTKAYWESINAELDNTASLTSDEDNEAERYVFTLDKDISKANTAFGTRTDELILTALGLAAGTIAGGSVGINVESHGRAQLHKPVAIERTVGWFTSCYPVVIGNKENIASEIISVKETMRRIPRNGIDYLILSDALHNSTDIIFNFYQNSVLDKEEDLVAFGSETSLFPGKISVDCSVINNTLSVYISVPKGKHKAGIAEDLGAELKKQIESIIDICTKTDEVIRTASDFSDDSLTEAELLEVKDIFGSENIEDIYSLTASQEGIYAQYFQNTDTKTYHLQNLCRISKDADPDILTKSIDMLSLRHPVLKTAVTTLKTSGNIKQVILSDRKPELRIINIDASFSQDALDKIISDDTDKSLDLKNDSLVRLTVIDFTDVRFMLMHTHHIILDGWCFPVIVNDLQKYYGKLCDGTSTDELITEISNEAKAQSSYAQYVSWIKSQDKKEVTKYWNELLLDASPAHIFGKEKKDNTKNENIVTFRTPLSHKVSDNIDTFAKENKVSHNTVFECAFSIAMQKYSGSDDVIFDKVISGRSIPLKNIHSTIGNFINTVPVRIRSTENSTLSDLIKETQAQTVGADKNGILPLSEVYKTIGIDSKSVDALFVFENYYTGDISQITYGPLSPEVVSFDEQTEFNLTITIIRDKDGYTIRTSYAEEMYTEREISRFLDGYISVLESSLDKDILIKDISIISEEESKLLDSFNETPHSYDIPDGSTIYSLFEKSAKANADKICLTTAEKALTFGELISISEALDFNIRQITEGKKSVIAVIAERSAEMYSAVYGIIRGGNAYVPIDPDYPQDRIDFILENSGAAAVVAQDKFKHLAGNVPCIDMTAFLEEAHNTEALPCLAEENDTAYVIYTSGSTGTPKGAKVSHKSAVNRILWMHDKYPLNSDDVILQKTPYTFDVSVWELFWWGMVGAGLTASKPGEHFLPAKILDEVENNKVTHLHFVPSVFELFLNYLEAHKDEVSKFSSVKYVFVSGEALMASLVQRFYNLFDFDKVTLNNLYGPTECAVDVTYYDCTPDDIDPVPIGKPIYNTQMHVVDKYMNLQPVGVIGELCIAGVNVGQGYLGNEKLTAEKFIDNPFGEGKLYKTGDLAYWREDGNIIFCGRMDSQIKLGGQRIEIGEIEAVINKLPEIESAAVLVTKDTLVAFYCGKKDCEEKIKDACAVKLPKYMVPSAVVNLDKMPLNQSGKLDRKALAQLKIDITATKINEAPVNDIEKFICKTFENILGETDIGRNSDFFDLGGTSLSMISLLSEDGFEEVSAAEFMSNSTPAKLALIITEKNKPVTEYLEPLYVPFGASKSIVLLPFAGGGAEAFSKLIAAIKQRSSDTSVYFVRYLHSFDECQKAANEISAVLGKTEITLYSHCVGSAVALQIIKNLEKDSIRINRYFAGASIPPAKVVKFNTWNIVPDFILKKILNNAGADMESLPAKTVKEILSRFRKDTSFAIMAYSDITYRLNTPVSIIISKYDMFTKNYDEAKTLWGKYFNNVCEPYFIDTHSHYFQSVNSNEVADIIFGIVL